MTLGADSELHTAGATGRIIVVDDDPGIREVVREFLARYGYEVETAADAAALNRLLALGPAPDLVVLDVMLPGEDGLQVCRRLADAQGGPAVIMLSAMGEETDRIVGLELGADDYLPKPCNPRELLARVRAVLRRRGERPNLQSHLGARCEFNGWRLDMVRRELRTPDGVIVNLSGGEFSLLRAFVEHPQRVLTRDQLLDFARGPDSDAYDRAVDVQISRLRRQARRRRRLGPDPHRPQRGLSVHPQGHAPLTPGMRLQLPRLRATLFVQVLTLVLVSLLAAQSINIAVLFSLPPPPPIIFRVSDVVQALQGGQGVSREGVPIALHVQDRPPPAYFAGRSTREATDELLQRLGLSPDGLVVSSEPLRFKMIGPLPGPRDTFRPMAWPRDDHLLIAPFKVAVRRKDGRWLVASPREAFPNVWQRRIMLWFVLSVAALAPLAYLFGRRLARPIREFAAAAERLGRDPGAPPLRLRGPPEIQQAASAFNGMQERLRRYVDDRTAMVGAVAHDLRTPLTRLRFRIEGAPDDIRDKVVADIDQMDAMISSALAFVRDATQPYERRRLELCSLVESVAVEMAETGLAVGVESAAPVIIEGDPVALRRLVTNLLDNAVKFGGCARARVYREAGAAVIEVDDDGSGVPEEERERVFEPFRRGEPSRSRETGGVGLGLAVVRSVARAHGGEAELANRPGGGLRASARLPL